MHLSAEEANRFFRIWLSVLRYVNEQMEIVPGLPIKDKPDGLHPEDIAPIRNALWENDHLRQKFITENPSQLPQADLDIVATWDHRVDEEFFIIRLTENDAIFLASNEDTAYGVQGITNGLDEMFGDYLPIYVDAVLIPFEARIIYDSLIVPYPVSFGPGYIASFEATYARLEERDGVTRQLPPPTPSDERIRQSYAHTLGAYRGYLGDSKMSAKKADEHVTNLTQFAEGFLLSQHPPVYLLDITTAHLNRYADMKAGAVNWVSFKRFVWFLRDTDRILWEDAEVLLATIKSQQAS